MNKHALLKEQYNHILALFLAFINTSINFAKTFAHSILYGYNENMGKISVKEIKAIMMVHEKADYSDKAKLKSLYNICVQRQMFSSKTGLKFQQAMLDIAEGRAVKETCIFCHGRITDGKGVVCDECIARLNEVIEAKKREIEEANRRRSVLKPALEKQTPIEEVPKTEAQAPVEEIPRAEAQTSTEEESQTQEKHEYVPFDFNRPEQEEETLAKKLSKQKPALFTVLGVLTVIIIMCIYLFAGKKIVANTTSDRGSELNYYMGKQFSILQDAFGKSSPIVSENVRYFKSACISVMYDATTGMINYLDIDGDGNPKTSILGVYPGMTKDAADAMLRTQNINKEDICEGGVYSYYIPYVDDNDYKMQLDVSYIDATVTMVSLQMMANDK